MQRKWLCQTKFYGKQIIVLKKCLCKENDYAKKLESKQKLGKQKLSKQKLGKQKLSKKN